MRGATECGKRLKLLFSLLRSKLGKVGHPPVTDPITQLILGILSRDAPETKASEGLERMRGMVVDYNELRVIPPIELAETLGDFPDARLKCEDISRALNAVFAQEHAVSLDRLASLPKKEVQAALEEIDGLEAYTRARIRLLGLRQHAIPLDEAMWALARAEVIVHRRCPLLEAQSFLERQISEEDALEFMALLKKQAWSEMGAAVNKREVAHILSVPPDRTSRNMLQVERGTRARAKAAARTGRARAPKARKHTTKAKRSASKRKAKVKTRSHVKVRASGRKTARHAATPKARRSASTENLSKPAARKAL